MERRMICRSLRYIRRTAGRLSRLPDRRLWVTEEDAGDAEYANECLDIALRLLGCRRDIFLPPLTGEETAAQLYRRFMKKASRQAGRLQRRLRACRKMAVPHEAWCNIDSAETHVRELAVCEWRKRRRCRWYFRERRP